MYAFRTLDGQHPSEIIRNQSGGNSRAWGQVEQFPVAVPFQELIEALADPFHGNRVVLDDVIQVASQEDQAAGPALAFFGIDTDLCAANLALQEELFFLRLSSFNSASRLERLSSSSALRLLSSSSSF